MHVVNEDWKNGWSGIRIGIDLNEIDRLIESLNSIKNDPDQHFHISSDYKGTGGVGDIEISLRNPKQPHNMTLSGRALSPGESLA